MEYQKIRNLIDNLHDKVPRFVTKKLIEVCDQSGAAEDRYRSSKQIRLKTSVLRSDICDYSDAYIVVKGNITVEGANNGGRKNRSLSFKDNAPFTVCISKINGVLIENAEDLDIVIPMYNLIEYSKNYSKITGSLWNYYRDKPNNPPANDYNENPITNSALSKYKNSFIEKTPNSDNDYNNLMQDVEIVVPLKYLSNFWRTLDMPLINCEINLILAWSKNVLTDMKETAAGGLNLPTTAARTSASFGIKDCKLYVPVVTLSAENDNTFRTIKSRI